MLIRFIICENFYLSIIYFAKLKRYKEKMKIYFAGKSQNFSVVIKETATFDLLSHEFYDLLIAHRNSINVCDYILIARKMQSLNFKKSNETKNIWKNINFLYIFFILFILSAEYYTSESTCITEYDHPNLTNRLSKVDKSDKRLLIDRDRILI